MPPKPAIRDPRKRQFVDLLKMRAKQRVKTDLKIKIIPKLTLHGSDCFQILLANKVIAEFTFSNIIPDELIIDRLILPKEARGLGLSRKIIEVISELGRQRGIKKIAVYVSPLDEAHVSNAELYKIYTQLGFRPLSQEKKVPRKRTNNYVIPMIKYI